MKRGLMHVDLPPPWSSICTSLSDVEYEVEPDEDEDEDEEKEEEEEDDEDASLSFPASGLPSASLSDEASDPSVSESELELSPDGGASFCLRNLSARFDK